jgi:hypothetical protein
VKLVAFLLMVVNIHFGLSMQAPSNNERLPEFTKGWTDSEKTQFRSLTFQTVTERTLYSFNPTQCPSASSAPSTTLPSVLLTRPGNT